MQCMISKNNVKITGDVVWMVKSLLQHNVFLLIFFKTMYNETIIRFGFCDIRNNQVLSKCYHVIPLSSTLIIPNITKTSSNNSLCQLVMY